MDAREVVEVGIAALTRGWIDAEDLVDALARFRSEPDDRRRERWIESGLLTQVQLDELCRHHESYVAFHETLQGQQGAAFARANTVDDEAGSPRYMVKQVLSQGGMGRILVCMDRELGRRVALKALRHDTQTPEHARNLAREARVTGNLEHPNIVPVYDVGVSDRDGPFYVMRLVDQPSLEHVLVSLRRQDPELTATWTLSRLLRTFIQVCQAVHYAHTRDVIHCDLKPDNILLGSFGEVLVGDWGLAFSGGQQMGGGTPGYMAPEQLAGADVIDARTDVFALGVVLYRILSLSQPFPGHHGSEILRARRAEPSPPLPSTVAPANRPVPEELEEIAMRAMARDPDARFQSAQAVTDAIEAFLEGTRATELRHRRANELVAQGDDLAARYHEGIEDRPRLAAELQAIRVGVLPWAPIEERRRVWDAEDEMAVFDGLQVRVLQEAVGCYEQALHEQAGHSGARHGLARLYADQVERARERRADLDRMYFEGLLRQHDDDGILVRAGGRPGWVNLDLTGDVDEVIMATLEERDRQLVPGLQRRLRRNALEAVPAAPGSYAMMIKAGGRRLLVPVLVRGDRETHVTIDLEASGLPAEDESFVAGGLATLGDPQLGMAHVDLHDEHVRAFFIQTFPVTFGRYLAFLEDVLAHASEQVSPLIPWLNEGQPLWTVNAGQLVPTTVHARLDMSPDSWPHIPAFGIDAACAAAYARWWSERTGRAYRLPTESEWEKAARGVDGRRFPWGDRFEAVFCKTRLSRPGPPRPEPVGAFVSDVSPYGVRDLAGGIADMCTPAPRDSHRSDPSDPLASRGGAWIDNPADCVVTVRRRVHLDERSARLGFRLVRDGIAAR